MFKCSTHLVECLRSMNIEPVAYASSSPQSAKNALIYSETVSEWYYTGGATTQQWWMVDFKAAVSISRYQIVTWTGCHYIDSWTIETSLDNETWNETDSIFRKTNPQKEIFKLKKPVKARYFKINGKSEACGNPFQFIFFFVKFFGKKPPKCTQNFKMWQKLNYVISTIILSR